MAIKTGSAVMKNSWSFTFDQASIAANTGVASSAQTAAGATTDGIYLVRRPSTLNAGINITADCTTDGQIIIRFFNVTAGAIDPPSLTYEVIRL